MYFFTFKRTDRPICYFMDGKKKKIVYLTTSNDIENIELTDKEMLLYPEERDGYTDRILFTGTSGSRKSTLMNSFLSSFYSIYGKCTKDAVLFTNQTDEDPAYENNSKDITHFVVSEAYEEDPPISKDDFVIRDEEDKYFNDKYQRRVILFDDYLDNGNKKIDNYIINLRNDCICNGRKLGLSTLVASNNLPLSDSSFRKIIQNCTYLVYFRISIPTNYKLALKYCGYDPEYIDELLKHLNYGTWIAFSTSLPLYIVYEKGCMMITSDKLNARIEELVVKSKVIKNLKKNEYIKELKDTL